MYNIYEGVSKVWDAALWTISLFYIKRVLIKLITLCIFFVLGEGNFNGSKDLNTFLMIFVVFQQKFNLIQILLKK